VTTAKSLRVTEKHGYFKTTLNINSKDSHTNYASQGSVQIATSSFYFYFSIKRSKPFNIFLWFAESIQNARFPRGSNELYYSSRNHCATGKYFILEIHEGGSRFNRTMALLSLGHVKTPS